jgi:hypothetical protein
MIQNAKTGKYSKGGCPCPIWTDNIDDAKVWKKKSFVKSHLTNIKKYSEPADDNDPYYWLVIECKIVPWNTFAAPTFS